MVKKNKTFMRLSAAFFAVFVFCLFLVSSFAAPAQAMVVIPAVGVDGQYYEPVLWEMALPFDRITENLVVPGMSAENPMYSVAVLDGYNVQTNIEMPSASSVADADLLGRWHFGVTTLTDNPEYSQYKIGNFQIQLDTSSNASNFTLSCSTPFVCSAEQFRAFSNMFWISVPAGYEYSCTAVVMLQYPRLVTEGGWELYGTRSSASVGFSNVNGNDAYGYAFPWWSDFKLDDIVGDKLFIVDYLTVTYDFYSPLQTAESISMLEFDVPFLDPTARLTFTDFYDEYPGHRVIVSDDPGASNFDLLVYLKEGIGGFMATEFAPGLSPGGILAACIGIALTLAFLKFFAGG